MRQNEALNQAAEYCKKHKVNEMMKTLLQALIVKQPDDPVGYLIKLLDNNKSMEEIMVEVDEMSVPIA
jgi:hypothetical protein